MILRGLCVFGVLTEGGGRNTQSSDEEQPELLVIRMSFRKGGFRRTRLVAAVEKIRKMTGVPACLAFLMSCELHDPAACLFGVIATDIVFVSKHVFSSRLCWLHFDCFSLRLTWQDLYCCLCGCCEVES